MFSIIHRYASRKWEIYCILLNCTVHATHDMSDRPNLSDQRLSNVAACIMVKCNASGSLPIECVRNQIDLEKE